MSFADKLVKSRGNNICLVIAPAPNGKQAWYFIRVESPKLKKFETDVFNGPVNLTEYGHVLHRGYGNYPPQTVIDDMTVQEGFNPKT